MRASGQRARLASRAVAGVGGDFLRVGARVSALIASSSGSSAPSVGDVGQHRWATITWLCAIDGDLGVVALDEAVPGRQDAAVGIGEVALRPVRRPAVGPALRPAVSIMPDDGPSASASSSPAARLGLGLQRRLGRADLRQPRCLVRHPVRHLVAAPLGAVAAHPPPVDPPRPAPASRATSAASFGLGLRIRP